MKPCITTWPARVPTDEDDRPEASSATPKAICAWLPTREPRRSNTSSMSSTPVSPRLWNTAAAMISIDMLIRPAMVIAMITSMRSKRKILRRSSSVRPTTRRWVSAECR